MAAYATRSSTRSVTRSNPPSSTFSRRSSAHPPPLYSSSPTAVTVKRTCLCSPTNHPGSFRCSLHKGGPGTVSSSLQTVSYGSSGRLNPRRSAVKKSLVRMGTAEGDLVRRALAAMIRPSSNQQRRRGEFRRPPSRLSVMSI